MPNDAAYVQIALNSWNSNLKAIDTFFASVSDEALYAEIAPGKNRLIYLMGHLAAVHDRMLPLLGLGERSHAELDAPFLLAKDRESELPPAAEVRKLWLEINAQLNAAMSALPASDWLSKHTAISDEDFAKEPHRNRYSVLLSRINHVAYHHAQLVLAPKAT